MPYSGALCRSCFEHSTLLLSFYRIKSIRAFCSRTRPLKHCRTQQAKVLKDDSDVKIADSQELDPNPTTNRINPNLCRPFEFESVQMSSNSLVPMHENTTTHSIPLSSQVHESRDSHQNLVHPGYPATRAEPRSSDFTQEWHNRSSPSSSSWPSTSSNKPVSAKSPGSRVDPLVMTLASPNSTTASPTIMRPLQSTWFLNPGWEIAAGLSKARLSALVVSTATVGCALAASTNLITPAFVLHPYQTIICLAIGTGLTSAAANTVNQIVEIPYDSQMIRTRNRVLVRGLTNPGRAGLFALGCASSGLLLLYLGTNPLVTCLAGGNLLLYTAIYTPLKQISQANTWVGAWVGAVPPLMGWAAATGEVHSGALILASLLYVWQFPHFMALSWNLRHEYSRAGYMMTAVLDPARCKRVSMHHAIAASLVCLAGAGCSAISLGPWAGCALGLACLPPNIGLIYYAARFARAPPGDGSSAAARRLFRATLIHLPVVMTAALIGTYFCATAG